MVVPGVFLIWFAVAALVVGLLTAVLPLAAPVQVVLFVVIALAAVLGSRALADPPPDRERDPMLNRRGAQLVGRQVVVTQAIEGGSGRRPLRRHRVARARPDSAPGQRLTVTGTTVRR
jgi:membrane protein implicated in regulation of membrane protease activity